MDRRPEEPRADEDLLREVASGDRFVIIASKGGAPKNPQWYRNLVADPNVEIEVGTRTIPVKAVVITGPERGELYARQAEKMPAFAESLVM